LAIPLQNRVKLLSLLHVLVKHFLYFFLYIFSDPYEQTVCNKKNFRVE